MRGTNACFTEPPASTLEAAGTIQHRHTDAPAMLAPALTREREGRGRGSGRGGVLKEEGRKGRGKE